MIQPPRGKWRPSLSLIVFSVLLAVFVLPFLVVGFMVYTGSSNVSLSLSMAPALGLAIVVVAGVGFVFVRAVTRPIGELTERTRRLMDGDRCAIAPLAWHGSREIAALSYGLFSMADGLFSRAEHISTFATHATHEIKSPLSSIRGAVELLLEDTGDMPADDRRRFLENMNADCARITLLLERMQELARADNPLDQGESTVERAIAGLRARFSNLTLDISGAIDQSVAIPLESLEIVLSHLIENAEQHGAGHVRVLATVDDNCLQITVTDDGNGVSCANEDRIFDLFFTTRRDGGGTGLGLGIVRTLLRAHNGDIVLLGNAAVKGAAFNIFIPLFLSK